MKSNRGFSNDALGRMLIPIQHFKAYMDSNPVDFRTKIRDGVEGYEVTGGDPLAFLYEDPENYDPTNLLSGFMRGYFLPCCLRAIFTGPRTAMRVPSPNDRPTQDSVAKLCKVEKVTVPIIVYVAMLPAWSGQDGKFDYQDFADMLFQVFKHNDDWTEQTIQWWNVELFGNENGLRSAGSAKGVTSRFLAMVKDQSKDRHAEKEVPEQMPVEEPDPWDKDSELTDTDVRGNDHPNALPSPSSLRSQTADVRRATTPSLKTCSRVNEDSDLHKDDDNITLPMPQLPRKRNTGK
ncbi:hypothetical protein EDB86DRAFT_2838038 [Lactarius hatsudake]|nr:hypothetical protein EDB86DRAFT_2838038 [Lactarius hatsudake]